MELSMFTPLKQLRLRQLDKRTAHWRQLGSLGPPQGGWLRAIRDALGMSAGQLAVRLGVTRQAVADLERRETDGTVTLAVLTKAADALDCDVVYAVVPRKPLYEILRDRARAIATNRLKGVAHSMNLEDQSVPEEEILQQVEDLADQIIQEFPRDLWTEPVA
jgi:predicted DNA-binding mobile mystery protein A